MADLAERLQQYPADPTLANDYAEVMLEAAATIQDLRAALDLARNQAIELAATAARLRSGLEAARKSNRVLLQAAEHALAWNERNTCTPEETYRGGAIWEICSSCGAKWADDEGGKPPHIEPAFMVELRAAIDSEIAKGA